MQDEIKKQSALKTIKQLGVKDRFIFETKTPFLLAIKELEKIALQESPLEMISCLFHSYARLKSAIVDHHKGKVELEAMDDVLPLTIYCVT